MEDRTAETGSRAPSKRPACHFRFWLACVSFCLTASLAPHTARARGNQYGGQDRADAAQEMIVLAVQQAIDALPPSSGQAFSYEYDAEKDTYVRSETLGPTALQSTRPLGKGRLSLRLAASYFDMSQSFGPMTYYIEPVDPKYQSGYANFGLQASATVGVFNLGAAYGITNRLDVFLDLPVTVVDAHATQTYTVTPDNLHVPVQQAPLGGAPTRAGLDAQLRNGTLVYRRETFGALGFDFNDGTHAGVGRTSIGSRAVLYAGERGRVAVATQVFFPSPNQADFAGSDSWAVFPRVLGEMPVIGPVRLLADVGYNYDFEKAELRSFVATGGALVAYERCSFDLGIRGTLYNKPITWTPASAYAGAYENIPAVDTVAQGNNQLGDDFVDFTGGVKVAVAANVVLSGALTVPLNNQGFRPPAFGTLGVEVYR
jgi:hypothetical protein